MIPGSSRFDRLLRLPGDLMAALAVVPAIAEHTASLYEMTRTLRSISDDTDALPPIRGDMRRVAEATSLLPDVDAKLKAISEAMPVLVEVQRHLAIHSSIKIRKTRHRAHRRALCDRWQ